MRKRRRKKCKVVHNTRIKFADSPLIIDRPYRIPLRQNTIPFLPHHFQECILLYSNTSQDHLVRNTMKRYREAIVSYFLVYKKLVNKC